MIELSDFNYEFYKIFKGERIFIFIKFLEIK